MESIKDKVWIIVVSYNGMSWIEMCLSSCDSYQVVVVDNASTDGTVTFIKKNFPDVILLEQSENLGFGQANNIGIAYALGEKADHVFLLNQDAYLSNNCLNKLIEIAELNSDYGILSPVHLNGKGDGLDLYFAEYIGPRKNLHLIGDFVLNKTKKSVYSVPFVNAAGWLISAECLMAVGGFDPLFFHYDEDRNYCQRTLFHGFKIGIVPNAFIKHDRKDRLLKSKTVLKKDHLERELKKFTLRFSDVLNENAVEEMHRKIKMERNQVIKQLVTFKLSEVSKYHTYFNELRELKKKIIDARKLNQTKGPKYLPL